MDNIQVATQLPCNSCEVIIDAIEEPAETLCCAGACTITQRTLYAESDTMNLVGNPPQDVGEVDMALNI